MSTLCPDCFGDGAIAYTTCPICDGYGELSDIEAAQLHAERLRDEEEE